MDTVLNDDVVLIRLMTLDDLDEWMAGEDAEQIRWFEFPGPAPRANVVKAIVTGICPGELVDRYATGPFATVNRTAFSVGSRFAISAPAR